ncbi:hypothetical protein [Bosea sp. (in: a-proteobacteria)]|uniref:hypothetical protein n=1 Tax=Bosea sp. (in: a-proteobacteria) TaxID=1871050 RepID=UPI003B3A7BEF
MTMTIPGPPARPLRRIQPNGSAAAVTLYLKTQWPRIGGPGLRPLPDTAFTNPAFIERYRPGTLTFPYLAACGPSFDDDLPSSGLKNVADRLHMPIFKLAATELADPRRRLDALDSDQYASHVLTPAGYVQEPGFKTWTFQQFLPDREPLPGSPVRLEGRLFALRRPHDMGKRVFEKLLHRHLRNASLNDFLLTPDGRAHCATLGLVPEQQQRWTRYRFGPVTRIDKAEELYIFRPSGEDSDRFLIILERIIHDWVMGKTRRLPGTWRDRSQYSRRGSAS